MVNTGHAKRWGFWLALSSALWALPGRGQGGNAELNWTHFVDRCASVRVLYLGEAHQGVWDHRLQTALVEEISRRRGVTVVAEMFQSLKQPVLEKFVAGELDQQQLFEESDWQNRWGHPWEMYWPIWDLCQTRHLPLIAMRNSTESGMGLSKLGVRAFTPEEQVGLAPEPYTFGPNPENLQRIFGQHDPLEPEAFERVLKVQTLSEEFMAAQIRKALAQNKPGLVVVLVGKGHLLYGHGLKARVQRELPHPIKQAVVLTNPDPLEALRTDLIWRAPLEMEMPLSK